MPKEIAKLDLDGYAVGGLAVGESHEEMYRILDGGCALSSVGETGLPDGCRHTGQYSGGRVKRCGLL